MGGREAYICAGKPHQVSIDEKILAMLRRGAALSSSQIAARTAKSSSHIADALRRLSERGAIVSDGPHKSKLWRINRASSPV